MLNVFRNFLKDQSASVTVEAILIMPILLWGYFGLFILFEGYRNLTSNIRVNFTVSDMLSREPGAVDAAYIEGLNDLQDVLTQSPHRTVLRVSVVSYDADTEDHTLEWSYSTDGKPDVTAGTMDNELVAFLPAMSDGEHLITVETWMAFVPFLDITLATLYDNTIREHHGHASALLWAALL